MNRILALMFVALIPLGVLARAEETSAQEQEIKQTLDRFIQAFDNLDWESFRAAFADDATVFYPRAVPNRAEGRTEFEHTFRQVFEQIRAGRTTGPYMDIRPRALKMQIAGDVAIVTFHLDDRPGFVNRRTIVLKKFPAGWKIIHLHASEVSAP